MKEDTRTPGETLEVIDALDHPHGGRILRIRATGENPPRLGSLERASLRAISPEGSERTARVLGFPLTGGKASDARFRETKRLDLMVEEAGTGPHISVGWRLYPTSS